MSIVLGIDTGGTYTDAVLFDNSTQKVISKAKALTTHQHLEKGIQAVIKTILKKASFDPKLISLVCVSTTLATNAVVEGVNKRICAVLIGLDQVKAISRELNDHLVHHDIVHLQGGHNGQGNELKPLDLSPLKTYLKTNKPAGFAISSYFSVRNPEHELATKAFLQTQLASSVTCSSELASDLDAPKRALTTLLNASLVGLLTDFIKAVETSLKHFDIAAPLMIVKGDGSLIKASEAKHKPIETIYSGPAASLVGACYLAKLDNAIISDTGGTTTDIAILQDGQPKLNPQGVQIGPWRTLVKAVDMHTFGLGGDSEIKLSFDGLNATLELGPRRILPLSWFATQEPDLVHDTLESQLNSDAWLEHYGYFVVPVSNDTQGLTQNEADLLESLKAKAKPLTKVINRRRDKITLNRLVSLKRVALSGLTPTDAAHVLGLHSAWDNEAALKAAQVFTKQKDKRAKRIAKDATELSERIHKRVSERSAELILETSLLADGFKQGSSLNPVVLSALAKHNKLVSLDLKLSHPIVGLGASAGLYYPTVGERLNTPAVIPEHAEVANAVGAVVGLVRTDIEILVTHPKKASFRVHFPEQTKDYSSLKEALNEAKNEGIRLATQKALASGAKDIEIQLRKEEKRPVIEGEELFLETKLFISAFGRPSF